MRIIKNPRAIELLADFRRAEILRLLNKRAMTGKQLSDELGITKAGVGYHIQLLLSARLIKLVKLEAKHSILQKYYAPTATIFIVDIDTIPRNAQRFFIEKQKEYLRGLFTDFGRRYHVYKLSSEKLDGLALALLKQLKEVAQKHLHDASPKDLEAFRGKLYSEVVGKLSKQKKWQHLLQQ